MGSRDNSREFSQKEDERWFNNQRYCRQCGRVLKDCICAANPPPPPKEEKPVKVGWFGLVGLQARINTEVLHPIDWFRKRREKRLARRKARNKPKD